MKANLKGGNIAVRFLLGHGEKLGMAGIVVCVGLLAWSAIGRERLGEDQQPEDLQQLVSRASTHIKDFRWDAVDEADKIVATPVSSEAMTDIPQEAFPSFPNTYLRNTLDPVGLRMDPVLLAAKDLEVNGDSGLWVTADPKRIEQKRLEALAKEKKAAKEQGKRGTGGPSRRGGPRGEGARGEGGLYDAPTRGTGRGAPKKRSKSGTIVIASRTGAQLQGYEDVKADSWVTVLGRIPIKQQHQLYSEALQNANGYDSGSDIPDYIGYIVQRAEITDKGQSEWKKIAQNSGKTIAKRLDTYPVEMRSVIDPRYSHPTLTHPLPPLILREWDGRASHSSMPLLSERDDSKPEEELIEDGTEAGEDDDLFSSPTAPVRRGSNAARRPSPRGRPAAPGMRGRGLAERGEYGVTEGGGESSVRSGGGIPRRSVGAALPTFTWDEKVSHVLFRYFDNTVKPGHKYRYRVQLVLKDVNNLSSEQYLDKTVVERRSKVDKKRRSYRFTEWSKPSPIASVPLPARIYLVGAKTVKETNFNAESKAELLIKALNSQYEAEIALADHFPRGSVLNVRENATVVWSNKFTSEQDSEFDFLTGITLLDFSGGEKLSTRNRNLVSPTRAVMMDASGRLFLQDELDDVQPVADYQRIIETGQDSSRGGGGRNRSPEAYGREGYGE